MKRLSLLLCLTIITCIVSAQNTKSYKGQMKVPSDLLFLEKIYSLPYDRQGEALYKYYEDADGTRVKHGSFRFNIFGGASNIFVIGNYVNGKKDGVWTIYRYSGLDSGFYDIENPVLDDQCLSLIINYKSDSIYGKYKYAKIEDYREIINSGNIINGQIQGRVIFEIGGYKMTFEVGADGMPAGIWTITANDEGIEKIQRRFFHKGALVAIDEFDNSTGERILKYCAFEGLNQAPNMDRIKDSITDKNFYIIYDGHIAIRMLDERKTVAVNNLLKSFMLDQPTSFIIPSELDVLADNLKLNEQKTKWSYVYSENQFNEQKRLEQLERKRFVHDSLLIIKKHQKEIKIANREFTSFLEDISSHYITGNKILNIDGKIEKCTNINGKITFIINKEKIGGKFSKEYVKTSVDEVYIQSSIVEVLSTEDGLILICKYHYDSHYNPTNVVLLIIKEGPKKGVYEITASAQQCL